MLLSGHVPSEVVRQVYHRTVLPDGGRDDMDMFVFGIVVADRYKGLFPVAHMLHILLGQFKKVRVAQPFSPRKVYCCMDIPFSGIMAVAQMVQHACEKFPVGIGIGIGVRKTQYGAFGFPQNIVENAMYIFPIEYPCYHFSFLVLSVFTNSSISSLAFLISRSRLAFGLRMFL